MVVIEIFYFNVHHVLKHERQNRIKVQNNIIITLRLNLWWILIRNIKSEFYIRFQLCPVPFLNGFLDDIQLILPTPGDFSHLHQLRQVKFQVSAYS